MEAGAESVKRFVPTAELLYFDPGQFALTSTPTRSPTGQAPLSVQEFVKKNAAKFAASAKAA